MPRVLKRGNVKSSRPSGGPSTGRETKRDRFVRLAEKRTSKALQTLRLISNLANRNNYEFTSADAKKIVGALTRETESIARRFEESLTKSASGFKL